MKFDELDLSRFVPNGVDYNESREVQKRGAVNAFFLKAFERWYRSEFQNLVMSVQAPYSLEALLACSSDELDTLLHEQGAEVYAELSHDTKAHYLYALCTTALGTEGILDAVVKYAQNSQSVRGSAIYEGRREHEYGILIEGDIAGSDITPSVVERLVENLDNVAPVTECFAGIASRDANLVECCVGGVGTTSSRVCHIKLSSPSLTTAFYLENGGNAPGTITPTITNGVTTYYSQDGSKWELIYSGEDISVEPGSKVYFKSTRSSWDASHYMQFGLDGTFECGGNVASLLNVSDWEEVTDLSSYPYAFYRLFYACTGLLTAPELPFTTLSEGCYYNMFYGCANLEKAPYLPAEVGKSSCYRQMFRGCSRLNEIRVNLKSGYGAQAVTGWVLHVLSTGDFYRPADATFWGSLTLGTNGIPTNFTVHDL